MVTLTPLGRTKAEQMGSGPQADILASLYENSGPMEADDIALDTGMAVEKVVMVCKRLAKDRLIESTR